ncbi:hypothetical protein AcV5_006784 [Taiwanofungus camphoratus]|nr:hypothetical protein AcV5_006784 [Antrodia cinnamomea]
MLESTNQGALSIGISAVDNAMFPYVFAFGMQVEEYLMERLGISTDNSTSVTLHELENTLANLTATLFWAAANVPYNRELEDEDESGSRYISLNSSEAAVTQIAFRLNAHRRYSSFSQLC